MIGHQALDPDVRTVVVLIGHRITLGHDLNRLMLVLVLLVLVARLPHQVLLSLLSQRLFLAHPWYEIQEAAQIRLGVLGCLR